MKRFALARDGAKLVVGHDGRLSKEGTPRTVQKLDRGVDGRSCITLLTGAEPANRDHVEGSVGLTVAATVEAVAISLAGGGG